MSCKQDVFVLEAVDEMSFEQIVTQVSGYERSDPNIMQFVFGSFKNFKRVFLEFSESVIIPQQKGMVSGILNREQVQKLRETQLRFVFEGQQYYVFANEQELSILKGLGLFEIDAPIKNSNTADQLTEEEFIDIKRMLWGEQNPYAKIKLFADQLPFSGDRALKVYERYEQMGINKRFTELGWEKELQVSW